MRTFAVLLLLILAVDLSAASAQWTKDSQPMPDTPWSKTMGEFGYMLALTDKPDEFFANWEQPGPNVSLSETAVARRGQPIVGVVLFTGCALDQRGFCNASVTYTVLRPDGTVYDEPQSGELWISKPPPRQGALELSVSNMGFVFDPGDPPGRYVMRAVIKDAVSGETVRLEREFEAIEK